MASAKKQPPAETNELWASLEECAVTYSIFDHGLSPRRIDDEALMAVTARITAIGSKHLKLVGSPLHLTLACARSYGEGALDGTTGRPALYSLSFAKDHCSALAYLPSEVFWGLRPMVSSGEIKTVQISYGRPRYGTADLIGLTFG